MLLCLLSKINFRGTEWPTFLTILLQCVVRKLLTYLLNVKLSIITLLIFSERRYMISPVRLWSVCLSVVCRLSVTFVRPTQSVKIFGNVWYLSHPLTSREIAESHMANLGFKNWNVLRE